MRGNLTGLNKKLNSQREAESSEKETTNLIIELHVALQTSINQTPEAATSAASLTYKEKSSSWSSFSSSQRRETTSLHFIKREASKGSSLVEGRKEGEKGKVNLVFPYKTHRNNKFPSDTHARVKQEETLIVTQRCKRRLNNEAHYFKITDTHIGYRNSDNIFQLFGCVRERCLRFIAISRPF